MAQQQVGQNQGYRCQEFEFFDQYVTIGYESASGDTSVPFLRVENCYLHGNSIVSTPSGTDLDVGTIELPCKSQFSTYGERTEGPPLADSQPFSLKNSSFR